MNKIYCVEDDESIRELITYAVKSAGFDAESFESASSFEKRLKTSLPSMVLLDIMLPDKDGIDILRDIRKNVRTKNLPVIMLTAKGTESDKVKGFENGADDYVTKPFGVMELISRIKAVLRRSAAQSPDVIDYKGMWFLLPDEGTTVDGLLTDWQQGESRTLDVHIGSLRHKLGAKGKCIETIRNVGYKI